MKRIAICISLLALAVFVAGCTQQSGTAKKPATTGKPAATSQADNSTTPATHTALKPITPAAGSGDAAAAKKPEAAKPVGTATTPANAEKPAEK